MFANYDVAMAALHHFIAGLACAAACHAALADRSRLSTESEVIDAGDCELETAIERTKASGSAPERRPSLQLNCGVGWRSELALLFASTQGNEPRLRAIGIEGKTALLDRAAGRIGWGLAYGVEAERSGESPWRRAGQFIALEAAYAIDKDWRVEARLGTARDLAARSDSTVWALALERALGAAFEARLELSGDDRQRPRWNASLRYEVWPDHALLSLSYGVRTGPARERQAGMSVTFEF